jgi:formylglycine-generating enzyme
MINRKVKSILDLSYVLVISTFAAYSAAQTTTAVDMQDIGTFHIDRTEVTIGQFAQFIAATKTVTTAEKNGGGSTYEAGWEQRKGWTWRSPFGRTASDKEPAVHVTYAEAKAFCQWAGKRLPKDEEWGQAAYTERRSKPTDGFLLGKTYKYPTGDSPIGANCLGDCGSVKTVANAVTSRGNGHSETGITKPGVNGLFDMGANAWEWVDSGKDADQEKRTRGGSWWYGAASMRNDHIQSKPIETAVIYIGFRCAKSK